MPTAQGFLQRPVSKVPRRKLRTLSGVSPPRCFRYGPSRSSVFHRPVLLVDDEPQVRSLIRAILSKHGFQVLEAADGERALSTVQAHTMVQSASWLPIIPCRVWMAVLSLDV